jgi:AraC-like DNA-binding protein
MVIACAKFLKLRIPEDIAVTGFGHWRTQHNADFFDKLTSCILNRKYIARLAINILIDILSGKRPSKNQQIELDPELIIGSSSLKKSYNKDNSEKLSLKNNIYHFIISNIEKSKSEINRELLTVLPYSKAYFSAKFKELFGTQFGTFVYNQKLKHAAQEIKYTHKSIMQILIDYGFSSHKHFWRQFEKQYDMSPQDYRKNTKSNI